MNLDLHSFSSFPAEITLEGEADLIDFETQGISFVDLMEVKLSIQEIGSEYFCQAFLTAPVEVECCRCLTLFDDELTSDFNFSVKIGEGASVLSSDGEESDVIKLEVGKYVADLNDVIREALILALPIKPLCDPDCRGLCPNCGINLNEETCKCTSAEIDDRWEDLKDLSH